MVWKDSYYMPNNKETEGLIFNSEDKKIKYFQKPFFPRNRTQWGQIKLMWRCWSLSENGCIIFLEKWDLSQKGDFDIAYSAVMDIGFNAYLRKFIVF